MRAFILCGKKKVDQWSALSISHQMIPQQITKNSNEFRTAKTTFDRVDYLYSYLNQNVQYLLSLVVYFKST